MIRTRIPRYYQISTSMKKEIVINSLENYNNKYPNIIHSDRGSQHTPLTYAEILEQYEIQHSMSNPATPVDNAVIEFFHHSIKRELINPNHHKSKVENESSHIIFIIEYILNL